MTTISEDIVLGGGDPSHGDKSTVSRLFAVARSLASRSPEAAAAAQDKAVTPPLRACGEDSNPESDLPGKLLVPLDPNQSVLDALVVPCFEGEKTALGGAQGVQAVHEHLKNELIMVMRLAATPNIKSITRDFVERSETQI